MKLPWWLPIILAGLLAVGVGLSETTPNAVAEMLVSERAEVVAEGERLLAAEKDQLFDRLLRDAASGNAKASGRAAVELGIFLSPWLRGKEAGARFVQYSNIPSPRRPVERVPNHPKAAAIRVALQSGIVKLMHQPHTSDATDVSQVDSALKALNETLAEVADDATMDWALKELAKGGDAASYRMDPLCDLAILYVGMPPLSSKRELCGLSTPKEAAQFEKMEKQRIAGSCATLQKAWGKVKPMTPDGRIQFSITAWRNHFVPIQKKSSGSFILDGYLFDVMESLVRFGEPAAALLRAQQQMETELEAKGVWEAIIATITGKEDPVLMKSLFEGRDPHLRLACQIVASAGSKAWLKELEELQRKTYFDQALVGKVIAISHGIDGLPSLEQAPSVNGFLIRELEARRDGKLQPGLQRYLIFYFADRKR